MNIPIIRLEVSGMKHEICTALSQHQLQMDQYVQEAIGQVCEESNLRAVVQEAVCRELKSAIEEAAQNYYKYGEGRQIVTQLVIDKLRKDLKSCVPKK